MRLAPIYAHISNRKDLKRKNSNKGKSMNK